MNGISPVCVFAQIIHTNPIVTIAPNTNRDISKQPELVCVLSFYNTVKMYFFI